MSSHLPGSRSSAVTSQSWTRLASCSLLGSAISPSMAEIFLAGQGLHHFWLKVVLPTSETFYLSALEGRDFSCSDSAILHYTFVWFTYLHNDFFLNPYLLKFNNLTSYMCFPKFTSLFLYSVIKSLVNKLVKHCHVIDACIYFSFLNSSMSWFVSENLFPMQPWNACSQSYSFHLKIPSFDTVSGARRLLNFLPHCSLCPTS